MGEITKISWGSLGIMRIAGRGPSDGTRTNLRETTILFESENVVPANALLFHMVELLLVVQTGEGLNFVVDFLEHREEAPGTLVIVGRAFGEIAKDILIDAGVAVVGGCKLANLDHRAVAEGLCVDVWKLTGQEITKKVEFGLMSVHGAGAFLLKKMKETVHEGIVIIRP